MDPTTIDLVRTSWAKVVPIADTVGKLFYANLFEADPMLKGMFKGDIEQQAGKLMQVVGAAVGKLDEPAVLLPMLEALGRRHVDYGVVPAHYDTVGAALLKTLGQGLGPAFTPQVQAAWTKVYGAMVEAMATQG